jgi:hypothetical protein
MQRTLGGRKPEGIGAVIRRLFGRASGLDRAAKEGFK